MNRIEKLKSHFAKNQNVLLIGNHGVGKTAMIRSVFESAGLVLGESYLYFSASTLDPWTDLIGVPKEVADESGNRVLDFVRPKALSNSSKVEAIFFDEYNRAPKKIRNAVMELIQFKSINGKRFPNLKVVWAAINPYTEEEVYDVEKLDPPQKDRFHIHLQIPYECDKEYFIAKFGEDNGVAAIEWWNDLPPEVKNEISPRRMDYALEHYTTGGDLEDVIPIYASNLGKLKSLLKFGPVQKALIKFMNEDDVKNAKAFISNENNYEQAKKYIRANEEMCKYYLPLINNEKIGLLMSEPESEIIKNTVFNHVRNSRSGVDKQPDITKKYDNLLQNIINACADKKLIGQIGAVYDGIAKEKLISTGTATTTNWSDQCSDIVGTMKKDELYAKLELLLNGNFLHNLPEAEASKYCAFLHMYVISSFSTKLTKMNSENFAEIYNRFMNSIPVPNRSCFINDEIFKAKISKMGLGMNSLGILVS